MKIKKIKINNFGNLKNKEINLQDKINVLYGENETGKSTLLKYIVSMIYGMSKNKNGKEISDYEYYKPWEGEEYSGKLIYTLDNKNEFEIFRDFNKKNAQIYNQGNDISKEFNIDKNKGNQFFSEQTKIDEDLFLSTQISMQGQVKLNIENENILIQKISNLLSTGHDTTSFKKIIEKLNKKLVEDIGTERTTERPLNLTVNRLSKLKTKRAELSKYNELKYNNEEKNKKNIEKIKKIEKNINLIKEIKKINEENLLEEEKIKINQDINEKNIQKIKELKNNKQKTLKNTNKKSNNTLKIMSIIIILIINIINIMIKTSLFFKIRFFHLNRRKLSYYNYIK